MQERHVSIGGETLPLPDPFLVLATQNPIEHEGTYPLPEAQLDRFMLKVLVDYPGREAERLVLERAIDGEEPTVEPVVTSVEVLRLRRAVADVEVNERLREYILRLMEATRDPARYQLGDLAPLIEFGASPRASVFLARAAQALAFIEGRAYVLPDDVKELAPDVLRHRLITTYEAEARGIDVEAIIGRDAQRRFHNDSIQRAMPPGPRLPSSPLRSAASRSARGASPPPLSPVITAASSAAAASSSPRLASTSPATTSG
jgi:MoxR-like ATPase